LECSKLKEMKKTGIISILIILALKSFSQTAPIAPKYIRTDSIGGFTDNTTLYIQPRGTGKIALSGLLFPSSDGTAGQVIKTDGSGVLSWTSGTGDVSKVGTPVDNQVGVWTGDGTLEGTNDFQFTGDTAYINGVSIGEIGGYPFVHNSLVGLGLIVGGGINISTSLGGNVRVYSATAGGGLANGITFYRGATRSGFFSGSTGDLTLDAGLFVATTTGTATALLGTSSANQAVDVTLGSNLSIVSGKLVQTIPYSVALSAATGDIATGTDVYSIRMPYAATLTGVKLSIGTAPVGSTVIVDINEAGTTILSTKLSIDASETTSATAATAAVISDAALADDAIISFDIDQVGSSTAGARLLITLSLRID
jgi:hypothetical protein